MAEKKEMVDQTYEDWYVVVTNYERSFRAWEGRASKIIDKYKDSSRYQTNPQAKFNILFSNVQTIQPAIFARLPRPDVSRRFKDTDPIGRVASMMLERALEYEIEHCGDYYSAMQNAVFDRLLGGRGTAWVRYEPHIVTAEGAPELDDGLEISEDIDDTDQTVEAREPEESIESEESPVDYVHWRDFGHTVARTWEEVTAVWRIVYMNRPALVERFGEDLGWKIPLDTKPDESSRTRKVTEGAYQAAIYEIWDKESGKVFWMSKSMGRILDEKDDPLELEGFFPCPKPLYSNVTTDSLEPMPDFTLYQDQARELDTLADRIDGLINALKVRGVYDASEPALARLFSEGENNTLIPVNNWQAFAEKQGMLGALNLVELKPFAEALTLAYQAMEQVKNQIYEIMGIADIQRGQTDPNETLGAQIIKSNNASGRLKTMQNNVVNFATKLLQIKAQIICKHYTPETIVQISGAMQMSPQDQMLIPQAIALLKDEPAANFRIEVTSDSMIYQDEEQEKNDRMAFLGAVSGFINNSLPVAVQAPELTPLLMEMLKFGVTAFKAGKQMEGLIDETADQFREQAKQMQGQPKPPPPEVQKLQMEMQADQAKEQARMQFEQAKMQMEAQQKDKDAALAAQIEQMKVDAEIQLAKAQQEFQAQENQLKFELENQRNERQAQMEFELESQKAEFENSKDILLTYLNNASKIETARISAGIDDGTQAYLSNVEQAKMLQAHLGLDEMAQYPVNATPTHNRVNEMLEQLLMEVTKPKKVIRDEQGRIAGVVHGEEPTQTPEGM